MSHVIPRLRGQVPVLIRLVTLGSRFALIFFLARLLPPADVGLYGLLTAMSGYAVLAMGFDLYTYVTRQLIRSPKNAWRTYLRSQASFSALSYVIGYPLILLLFVTGLLPWSLIWWFIVLVPLEHLGLELDRILIAMSDQLGASIGMFVRQATTPLLVVPLMALIPELRTLPFVLAAWVGFDALGVLIGMLFVRRQIADHPKGRMDWRWVRRGVIAALPFIVGTLCLRALFTVDRQVVSLNAGLDVLGAYALFMTMAGGMTQVLAAGVHQFVYPRLVWTAHHDNRAGYFAALGRLAWQTAAVVIGASAALIAFEPLVLQFVGKPVYMEYAGILPWALAVTGIYNLSLIPHFGLYALDADKTILLTTVLALATFIGLAFGLLPLGGIVSVLIGIGGASTLLLASKTIALVAFLRRRRWSDAEADIHRVPRH